MTKLSTLCVLLAAVFLMGCGQRTTEPPAATPEQEHTEQTANAQRLEATWSAMQLGDEDIVEVPPALGRLYHIYENDNDDSCLYDIESGTVLIRLRPDTRPFLKVFRVTGLVPGDAATLDVVQLEARDLDNKVVAFEVDYHDTRWNEVEAVLCPGEAGYQEALLNFFVPDLRQRQAWRAG